MIANEGEYWCPDCRKRRAEDYQEVRETCGMRGREIWLCPECAQDLVHVDPPLEHCPYCARDLVSAVPESDQGFKIECPEHGPMTVRIFPDRVAES